MTMINPNPASVPSHHHQSFSKHKFSCHKRVYVMSRIEKEEEEGEEGYGCTTTTATKLQLKLEPESTNHQLIQTRSDSESEREEQEEEEEDHHHHQQQQLNLMSDQQDESRTNSERDVNEGTTTASASVRDHNNEEDEKWLQLSIGGGGGPGGGGSGLAAASHNGRHHHQNLGSSTSMVELDLLPGSSSSTRANNNTTAASSSSSMFNAPEFGAHLALRPPPFPNIFPTGGGGGNRNGNGNGASSSSNYHNYYYSSGTNNNNTSWFMPQYHHGDHQIEFNWGGGSFRPFQYPHTNILSSSSSRLVHPTAAATVEGSASSAAGSYFAQRPFLFHAGLGLAGPPPRRQSTIDFRVIDPPPRRPFSGIWFVLQAAQNQAKEPFLPQIPKSFLRIKDGKMTIRLVMKYLANKLKLEDESEVEIKCRGQQMQPMLTLQHVRDSIWTTTTSPSNLVTLLPDSSPTDHIMVLHYGRSP